MNFKKIEGGVCAAKGFKASGAAAGIKKGSTKLDVTLIASDKDCAAAAVYTQNLVKGAPIAVCKKHLEKGTAKAIICNSGNANTCNADGVEKAQKMCQIAGEILDIDPKDVVVASTGVIGQVLNIEPIENVKGKLKESLSYDGSDMAATAIMTTDTYKKEYAVSFELDGKTVSVGGIAKGSGMIHPNMATMLCFVTTDCSISSDMLGIAVKKAADLSFNMISVDGDTSTNDMLCCLANGMAENELIAEQGEEFELFFLGLLEVCKQLSKLMAADGEGATKLIICKTVGANDQPTAKTVAKSVICSNLFKAAMFGEDANWGRILCAIGYSGASVDVEKIDVSFESENGLLDVCKDGAGIDFSEQKAKKVLSSKEITVLVDLKSGTEQAEAYGCDLTYDYVKINGDYRT